MRHHEERAPIRVALWIAALLTLPVALPAETESSPWDVEVGGGVLLYQPEVERVPRGSTTSTTELAVSASVGRRLSQRLALRLGLTENQDPDKIEKDVGDLLPKKRWRRFSDILIYHGREVCKARKPDHDQCAVMELCPSRGS